MKKELENLLFQHEEFLVEGVLNKNKLSELARKYDAKLLNVLMKEEKIKNHFFSELEEGILVFKKDVFLQFLNNKEFLPDSFTAYKTKIGLGNKNGSLLSENHEVVLNFPYKDCILEGGQTKEDAKRDEVFFNETLAPTEITRLLDDKVFTNFKRYDKDGEHEVKELKENDNLIIKGNNLVVLHSLKKKYAGKVKCIYIDPPYNTGSDSFGYNDRFNHSTWLTFMKNRLVIAKDLLSDDGVIFVQCDDNEQAYLKVLMDEIFGNSNFINTIAVKTSTPSGVKMAHINKKILKTKEYLLCYAKNSELLNLYPQYMIKDKYDWEYTHFIEKNNSNDIANWEVKNLKDVLVQRGIIENKRQEILMNNQNFKKFYIENADLIWARGRHHNIPKEVYEKSKLEKNKVFSYKIGDETHYAYRGRRMAFLSKTIKNCLNREGDKVRDIAIAICDFWEFINTGKLFSEGNVEFSNGKKPELIIYNILSLVTKEGDIVLDYHLGSGTTAAVAQKMNRRFIGVEQMEYINTVTCNRLISVIEGEQGGISKTVNWRGGGEFVYCELKNDALDFKNSVIRADSTEELIELFNIAKKSSFLSYRINPKILKENEFLGLSISNQKQLLIKIIDNNNLYVNYSDIDDDKYKVNEEEKKLNEKIYRMEGWKHGAK